jgi:catechol 2,3-dioxygenase-like lactoylglutathione lyase family enzyme
LEETIAWYGNCLRLEKLDKPEGTRLGGAWFGAGPQEVHISEDEHNPPKESHFALVVDNFEPVIECLRAEGCHIEQAVTIPGRHRFYTRDPAGNRVEIVHYDEVEVVALETSRGESRARVVHEES